jgi:hypothetical protein
VTAASMPTEAPKQTEARIGMTTPVASYQPIRPPFRALASTASMGSLVYQRAIRRERRVTKMALQAKASAILK